MVVFGGRLHPIAEVAGVRALHDGVMSFARDVAEPLDELVVVLANDEVSDVGRVEVAVEAGVVAARHIESRRLVA